MYWVYVLRCSDGSLYIGHTQDLRVRLLAHRSGRVKWTSSRLPVVLVHTETFGSRAEAVTRERALKTGFGRKWLRRLLR